MPPETFNSFPWPSHFLDRCYIRSVIFEDVFQLFVGPGTVERSHVPGGDPHFFCSSVPSGTSLKAVIRTGRLLSVEFSNKLGLGAQSLSDLRHRLRCVGCTLRTFVHGIRTYHLIHVYIASRLIQHRHPLRPNLTWITAVAEFKHIASRLVQVQTPANSRS